MEGGEDMEPMSLEQRAALRSKTQQIIGTRHFCIPSLWSQAQKLKALGWGDREVAEQA